MLVLSMMQNDTADSATAAKMAFSTLEYFSKISVSKGNSRN